MFVIEMTDNMKKVLDFIGDETKHIDDINKGTELPMYDVSAALCMLELNGKVGQMAGKLFSRWCHIWNWINNQLHRKDDFYWIEGGDPPVKRNILALDAAIKFDLDYIGDRKIRQRLIEIVRECELKE